MSLEDLKNIKSRLDKLQGYIQVVAKKNHNILFWGSQANHRSGVWNTSHCCTLWHPHSKRRRILTSYHRCHTKTSQDTDTAHPFGHNRYEATSSRIICKTHHVGSYRHNDTTANLSNCSHTSTQRKWEWISWTSRTHERHSVITAITLNEINKCMARTFMQ